MEKDIRLNDDQTASLQRAITNQRRLYIAEWKQHPLTLEQLQDNANIGKIGRMLGGEDMTKEDKPSKESETIIRHGDIEPPAREVFSNKEMNRMTEVRENSPEQQNNSKGKSKMSMLSEGIRRQVTNILRPGIRLSIGRR